MSLVEYLYVDEERLDSYFEQISSPVAYDKVPVWKAGLSITTLGADATQSRFPRAFTTHEKITQVKEYLESNHLLGPLSSLRPSKLRDYAFYVGRFLATRAYIPAKAELSDVFPGLTLWFASLLSPSADDLNIPLEDSIHVTLLLLEDFQRNDEAIKLKHVSGHSALSMLQNVMIASKAELKKTVVDTDWIASMNEVRSRRADSIFSSDSEVVSCLRELGAHIGGERPITCLFRVRELVSGVAFSEEEGQQKALRVFGYPIFIAVSDQHDLAASNE